MFEAEKQSPSKGKWVSKVSKLLTKYNIEITFLEVKEMGTSLFKSLVNRKVTNVAIFYLVQRLKSMKKGKYIENTSLKMTDYLLP